MFPIDRLITVHGYLLRLRDRQHAIDSLRAEFLGSAARPFDFDRIDSRVLAQPERECQLRLGTVA